MTTKTFQRDFLAGRNLAIAAIHELEGEGEDRCCIEAEYRDGLDQSDALVRAIEGLRAAPSTVIRGFAAVLTEIAGCSVVTRTEVMEGLTFREMVGTSAAARPSDRSSRAAQPTGE